MPDYEKILDFIFPARKALSNAASSPKTPTPPPTDNAAMDDMKKRIAATVVQKRPELADLAVPSPPKKDVKK